MRTEFHKTFREAQGFASEHVRWCDKINDSPLFNSYRREGVKNEFRRRLKVWQGQPKAVLSAAHLLIKCSDNVHGHPQDVDVSDALNTLPSLTDAASILSNCLDWHCMSVDQAEQMAQDIRVKLWRNVCCCHDLSTHDIIASYQVWSKHTAALISSKLVDLHKNSEMGGDLAMGLLLALDKWNQIQWYGEVRPDDLIKLRESYRPRNPSEPKKISQAFMAESLGISRRQYIRYESGETPVSNEMWLKIKACMATDSPPYS